MLKLDSSTFGALVRPRVLLKTLTNPTLSPQNNKKEQEGILNRIFNVEAEELFDTLHLGDTTKSFSDCYVGKVVSFILFFPLTQEYEQVYLAKMKHLENIAKNRNGRKWEICAVGLQFYQGLQVNQEGYLEATNPWITTKDKGSEWFYVPQDLVLMDDVVVFERCEPGDFVNTPKSSGMVIYVKKLNKPQFYRTSSWSCKNITLFSGVQGKKLRLLPSRQITITRFDSNHNPFNPLVNP